MTRHPDSDDTFTIPPADRAIIHRALLERINRLHATAGDVAHVTSREHAQPLLDEAQRVGALLDVIDAAEVQP